MPYGDLEAIRAVAEHNKNIVAVMLEIIQGEGGIHLADPAYYEGVRACCNEHDWLMICDEVQCGMARTGKWFGYQQVGTQPDIATLAKGLGSGVPIGACVEDEAGNLPPNSLAPAPQLTWVWRHQTRMSLLSLMAAQNAYRFWQNTWDNMYAQKKAA